MKYVYKTVNAYFLITTSFVATALILIIYDVFQYKLSGQFVLFPSLNTVQYTTVEEAWKYAETLSTWGETEWMQMIIKYIFFIWKFNLFWSFAARTFNILKNRKIFIYTLLTNLSLLITYFAYRWFIFGCVSESYIQKVLF